MELRTFPKKLGFSELKTNLRREFWNILRGETLVVHATAFLSNDRFLLKPSTRAIKSKGVERHFNVTLTSFHVKNEVKVVKATLFTVQSFFFHMKNNKILSLSSLEIISITQIWVIWCKFQLRWRLRHVIKEQKSPVSTCCRHAKAKINTKVDKKQKLQKVGEHVRELRNTCFGVTFKNHTTFSFLQEKKRSCSRHSIQDSFILGERSGRIFPRAIFGSNPIINPFSGLYHQLHPEQ